MSEKPLSRKDFAAQYQDRNILRYAWSRVNWVFEWIWYAATTIPVFKVLGAGITVGLAYLGGWELYLDLKERDTTRQLAAWQTISSAAGEPGDLGRKIALQFLNTRKPNVSLAKTPLSKAELPEIQLSGASLDRANLSEANLRDADLRNADLDSADLRGIMLNGANLNGTKFHNADLCEANLRGTNLQQSELILANLSKAKFGNADLSNADLFEADLSCADLSEISEQSLNCEQLLAASHWNFAKLPAHLSACGGAEPAEQNLFEQHCTDQASSEWTNKNLDERCPPRISN